MWDGTPDFRGVWQAKGTAYVNIEGHPAMNGVAASKSIIVDPADGKIPYKPEALKQRDENFKDRATADPDVKCFEPGVPRATYLNSPMQILQSSGNFTIVYQEAHSFQIVYPQLKPHFEGIDWWMGDSRGHWEGNTYVVDVTDLTSTAWLDEAGNYYQDNVHVVTKYTMTGPNTIQYEARVEDPDTYTEPWTMRVTLDRAKPGTRILEDECLDDENNVRHKISPSDPKALLRNEYRRWDKLAPTVPVSSLALPPDPPYERPKPSGDIPRLPNGKPDMNGLWSKALPFGLTGGRGGRGTGGAGAAAGAAAPAGRGAPTPTDLGAFAARAPKPGSDASGDFRNAGVPKAPYSAAGFLEMEWRGMHDFLDGEPRCHLAGVPRAAQQPPYPHQIIEDDRDFTVIYEYVHEPRIIPMDGSAHPKNYWAWDGDSRGNWDGDTLVVDFANSNGRTWLDMMGNFVDENEHVVERYTMLDKDTMNYEATITDPVIFSKPWTMHFLVKRQPDEDQILEYGCLEGEQDRQHYTEEYGGHAGVATNNGELLKKPEDIDKTAQAAPSETVVKGCLRPAPTGEANSYVVDTDQGVVPVTVSKEIADLTQPLLDRTVRFRGDWQGQGKDKRLQAIAVRVLVEGCSGK
jgi:hypothetical protein